MNKDDFNYVMDCAPSIARRVGYNNCSDKTPRTLLYGYDCDRNSFHVFIRDNTIYRMVYTGSGDKCAVVSLDSSNNWIPEELISNKRLYPESCDFAFCILLQNLGINLPFTKFDETRFAKVKDLVYHGEIHVRV